MTFSRSWRLAPESAPTRCDSASRMRSSSSECARSPLVSALTPSTERVAFYGRRRSARGPGGGGPPGGPPGAPGRPGFGPRRPPPHHGELRGKEEGVHHDQGGGNRDEEGVGDHPRRGGTPRRDARGTLPGEASA